MSKAITQTVLKCNKCGEEFVLNEQENENQTIRAATPGAAMQFNAKHVYQCFEAEEIVPGFSPFETIVREADAPALN